MVLLFYYKLRASRNERHLELIRKYEDKTLIASSKKKKNSTKKVCERSGIRMDTLCFIFILQHQTRAREKEGVRSGNKNEPTSVCIAPGLIVSKLYFVVIRVENEYLNDFRGCSLLDVWRTTDCNDDGNLWTRKQKWKGFKVEMWKKCNFTSTVRQWLNALKTKRGNHRDRDREP